MQAICTANWSNLTLCEKASDWKWSKQLLEAGRIVAGCRKESASTTVAGEDQCPRRSLLRLSRKQCLKVFMGRVGVANMKLDRLAGAYQVPNSDHTSFWVCANDIANKKIARFKVILILACYSAHVERVFDKLLVVVIECFIDGP